MLWFLLLVLWCASAHGPSHFIVFLPRTNTDQRYYTPVGIRSSMVTMTQAREDSTQASTPAPRTSFSREVGVIDINRDPEQKTTTHPEKTHVHNCLSAVRKFIKPTSVSTTEAWKVNLAILGDGRRFLIIHRRTWVKVCYNSISFANILPANRMFLAKNSSANTLFILSYNARHVLAVKSKSFEAVLSAILDHFPDTIRRKITLQTKELELCDGVYTEIPPCLWNHVMDEIKSVTVVAEDVVVQSGVHCQSLICCNAVAAAEDRLQVQTKEDGRLTELSTVLDVSYLFWEAVIDPTVPISPPPSPVQSYTAQAMESFHPMLSNLSSVLLSVDVITPYFGQALKNLRLHTEARTSFIT
ncbi:hypothetical protein L208DRAFT_1376739 [Tricholoma matsutake]|nr:hypothetical protein L208DRAFT_1376739 [Tricholoma matsutake 945]